MADRSSFSAKANIATDPRRAYRMAERMMGQNAAFDPIAAASLPPGQVTADHAGFTQLLASGINFDKAGFGYDATAYTGKSVSGAAGSGWSKVGNSPNDLRIPLGPLTKPVYVWIWATLSWKGSGTTDDAQLAVAVLYDSLGSSSHGLVRATNPTQNWGFQDSFYKSLSYIGFIGIDVANDITIGNGNPNYTGQGDWNIGMQCEYAATDKVANQSFNRQSIIVFVTARPPGGVSNFVADVTLA